MPKGPYVTVYLRQDDVVKLKVLQSQLKRGYPFQRVSKSWVLRYCLYKELAGRGLTDSRAGREAGLRPYGNEEVGA